ncbi:MAG: glycosyltransferase family 39 protein [Chloroflexi bacterium]|nr:glycosyltransferase family 39 protein [Chloroflexota bacterium]
MLVTILIVGLAFLLRVYHLNGQSLWYDEGFSAFLSQQGLAEITARTAADIHPPLYYYLLHLWIPLAGDGEFALRFPSAVFGVLSVPLFYQVGRRLFGNQIGLLSALMATLSPFYVWYSQEARMYTLVTLLGLCSSYLLLRLLEGYAARGREPLSGSSGRILSLWAGFMAINVAAIYTHFYALFLVAFQAIYLLIYGVSRARRGRLFWHACLAFGAIGASYLPWSGFVLTRYRADTSYWEGSLALGAMLRRVLLDFSTGHTVYEPEAEKIAVVYLLVFVLGVGGSVALALGRWHLLEMGQISSWRPLAATFSILYVAVPVLLVYAISFNRPKFHSRYLMLASPAFFWLISLGIRALGGDSKALLLVKRTWTRLALGLAAFGFIIGTSGMALAANYSNRVYVRDDFRSVARYIQAHQGPREAVILVSGHMKPVFSYYYSRGDVFSIPDVPTLSTKAIVNYHVAETLDQVAQGHTGAWVVLWQDQVVDPNGILLGLLDERAKRLPVDKGFWGIELRHYSFAPGVAFPTQPEIENPQTVDFEDKVEFRGFSLRASDSPADQDLGLTLFWFARRPLNADYRVSIRVKDEAGHEWGRVDQRPSSYLYPTTRWQSGEIIPGQVKLRLEPGTPPGEYRLELGLYDSATRINLNVLDQMGRPAGQVKAIGLVQIDRVWGKATLRDLGLRYTLGQRLDDGLELLGYDLNPDKAKPGEDLELTALWGASRRLDREYVEGLELCVGKATPSGRRQCVRAGDVHALASATYPTTAWLPGTVVRGKHYFRLPADLEPGEWGAWLLLFARDSGIPLEEVVLKDVIVEAMPYSTIIPSMSNALRADFEQGISLLGFDVSPERPRPGAELELTLYWRSSGEVSRPYTVFTHLLDARDVIKGQHDGVPAGGGRPTTTWRKDEVITDRHLLPVKPEVRPGDYLLEVGLYDAASGKRLAILDDKGQPVGDRVVLRLITVGP